MAKKGGLDVRKSSYSYICFFFVNVGSSISRTNWEYLNCVVNFLFKFLETMGKTRFKYIRLFLKLLLFFQIYSHQQFEAEANETPFNPKSFDGSKANDDVGTESNDKSCEKEIVDDVLEIQKRPARLLPFNFFL